MKSPRFGAVADDDTGATDLGGMLTAQGLRVVVAMNSSNMEQLAGWAHGHDALIIAAGTRALPVRTAYENTRASIRALNNFNLRTIQIKYCSTFDSTAEGNIGASVEAAMDELGVPFTVALPALPLAGRTTYMGYHFVHRQLLSDSPMRNHPLTPMTNAHLVSHLQSQTRLRVGLAEYPVSQAKIDRLYSAGIQIAVLDCISDEDLGSVCECITNLRLISGSSAPAMKLAPLWRSEEGQTYERLCVPCTRGRGVLIVAGSCSSATVAQNRWIEQGGGHCVTLDPLALATGDTYRSRVHKVTTQLSNDGICLLKIDSSLGDVARVRKWATELSIDVNEAGKRIAFGLAAMVDRILEAIRPAGLIVAGGETSTAVCRALDVGALEVGQNIEPGVPICVGLGQLRLPIVLKSGNFGGEDFYSRAIAACRSFS